MQSIDVNTLKDRIANLESQILLDVREPWEFSHCKIDGSINIPLDQIDAWLNELVYKEDIVVICHHGSRSLQVAQYLEDYGLDNKILNLEGGIDSWAERIETNLPRY